MSWIDLSQPLWEGSDRAGRASAPRFEQLLSIERDHFSMMEYTFVSHIGTHLDAPSHFVAGGLTIDQIPLDRVIGRGVVLGVTAGRNAGVSGDALARGGPTPGPQEIVLIHTGWEDKAGTAEYFQHPYLLDSAVDWLIEHRVKVVGMDLITPETPESVREGEFTWPVHKALLARNILVIENVCNMTSLVGRRVDVMAAPINVKGGDGAPVRLLAQPVADEAGA